MRRGGAGGIRGRKDNKAFGKCLITLFPLEAYRHQRNRGSVFQAPHYLGHSGALASSSF